jgi:HlyD family secretion protein
MPKRKSRKKPVLIVMVLLLIAGSASFHFRNQREQPIAIQTEKVMRRDLTETVVATGKIQPVVQVKISPEVSGEIIELPVREGQRVEKGDLLLKIKPDFYVASRNSAEANLQAANANLDLARANLKKAAAEFQRHTQLRAAELISDSQFLEASTAFEVAQAQVKSATHNGDVARAALARVEEELAKTTIYAPLSGTISKLNSQAGERVVGTAMMTGTEVMVIANLGEMEARVDIGEMDVVLIAAGQQASLEVDAFRDKKFSGTVTEIANTAKTSGPGTQQEATRFEVRIRVQDEAAFRPGMSVTAEIQTRSRTNVLTVPIQSVTTRLPSGDKDSGNDSPGIGTPAQAATIEKEAPKKPVEVVFVMEGDQVRQLPVKRGISDDSYVEIVTGVEAGQAVVSGSYIAINRELADGKKVKIGTEKRK